MNTKTTNHKSMLRALRSKMKLDGAFDGRFRSKQFRNKKKYDRTQDKFQYLKDNND